MKIKRNMAMVRHDGEFILVDPIRLSPDEEKRLDGLGKVERILRLGPMHGVDRYGGELWVAGRSEAHPEPKPAIVWDSATATARIRSAALGPRDLPPVRRARALRERRGPDLFALTADVPRDELFCRR